MPFTLDARIAVSLGSPDQVGPDDALLAEGGHPAAAAAFTPGRPRQPGHSAACPCCSPQSQAGRALTGLLQDRARRKIPFFRRVVAYAVTDAGRAELLEALASDPVASACFRLLGGR